ncbi:rhomboid family intramembrane serine protease [Bacillus sp. MUM 13]|uniref:rhomboid family intramembrane serine protease n=1 Tax=Bacillus sp. MUM 13 TaxID=1678001 RepID=UPI00147ABAA6|nr:rhomboid family intramembrane serine protease [Bacillus sp. MUM 13]
MYKKTALNLQPSGISPAVTGILTLIGLVFIVILIPAMPGLLIFQKLAGVNLFIRNGQLWRLLTPIFLHTSLGHLLFNSFSLALLGPKAERTLGSLKFTLLFLLSGIMSNMATFLCRPLTYTHTGASGAIFGILGFYLYSALARRDIIPMRQPSIFYTFIIVSVIASFIQPEVNGIGHLGGLAGGFLLAALFLKERKRLG